MPLSAHLEVMVVSTSLIWGLFLHLGARSLLQLIPLPRREVGDMGLLMAFLKILLRKKWTLVDSTGNYPSLGTFVSSGEPIIGLKQGKQTFSEDLHAGSTTKTSTISMIPTSSTVPTKRSRASY
jgi:hypothetical protein